jgi:hypothetical protein
MDSEFISKTSGVISEMIRTKQMAKDGNTKIDSSINKITNYTPNFKKCSAKDCTCNPEPIFEEIKRMSVSELSNIKKVLEEIENKI